MRPTLIRVQRVALVALSALIVDAACNAADARKVGLCQFDSTSLVFEGTASQQAECLLRRVELAATGSTPQVVPEWFRGHVGAPTDIPISKLAKYLASANIDASAVGGKLAEEPDVPEKKYLVIHDTSYPEIKFPKGFPADINDASYAVNKFKIWTRTRTAVKVNVITNRLGGSYTFQFLTKSRPSPATKLEESSRYPQSRKVFLHVENVQPRIQTKKKGPFAQAPEPGFSPPQRERLALVYVVASIRAGHWLIPAFHFNIDSGVAPDPHDDPQNFDLAAWGKDVQSIAEKVAAQ